MTRLRWRLARWIAPTAIIADPTEGRDGAFVLMRDGSTTMATAQLDHFRIRTSLRLPEGWNTDRMFGDFGRSFSQTYIFGRLR